MLIHGKRKTPDPFPLGTWTLPPLIHPCRDRSRSPDQTIHRSIHAISHKYAAKYRPLVTIGRPKFTPKTARSPSTITTHLIHASLGRLHSPPQTASRSIQPFCHNTLSGQTDRPTDRSDDLGEKLVSRVLTL